MGVVQILVMLSTYNDGVSGSSSSSDFGKCRKAGEIVALSQTVGWLIAER